MILGKSLEMVAAHPEQAPIIYDILQRIGLVEPTKLIEPKKPIELPGIPKKDKG